MTYSDIWIGLHFEERIQNKLKEGMVIFKDNCMVEIIEKETGETIGISQNCKLDEFKVGDILSSSNKR